MASEVQLALWYKKPVIAFLKIWNEIEGLPGEVRVEPEWDRVKEFIRANITKVE